MSRFLLFTCSSRIKTVSQKLLRSVVRKHPGFTPLLALFSGVSVLSFGIAYFTTLQFKPTVFQALKTSQTIPFPRKVAKQKVLGLPLNQVRQILRQASFKFLTTSAYSLVDSNRKAPHNHVLKPGRFKDQPSTLGSSDILNLTRKAKTDQVRRCCKTDDDLREHAFEFELTGSQGRNS